MQTDEDVGKVAAAVPVIISRALELFIESLIMKASHTTQIRHAKTLTTAHIKQTIEAEKKFDFLRDLVVNIADHQTEDDCDGGNGPVSHLNETSKKYGRVGNRGPRKRKDSATSLASSENTRRSKQQQQQQQHEEDEEEEDNNSEETDDADSDEDEDLDQNQTEEEETATTSSCLRGDDEESPVPSSNGFPPPPPTTKTTSVPTGYHSFGQPSSQFKIPTLYTTTSLSRMLLPPGQTLGQQEDDDYDT